MKNVDLAKLLIQHSYRTSPPGEEFLLASGDTSDHYFECQRSTLLARAMPLIGRAVIDKLAEMNLRPDCIGGLVLGADPIMMAAIQQAESRGMELHGIRVRKEPKDHGTCQWIEGTATSGMSVVVVDDVVTRGTSVKRAIKTCRDEGLSVIGCIVLVDREENGGMANIEDALQGAPIASIFSWTQLKPIIDEEYGDTADAYVDRELPR